MAWDFHNPQSQIKGEVLVGVPYKQNFSAKFLSGLVGLQFPDYFAHSVYLQTGQPLDIARNIMVSNALQRNVSHLFFVDEDVVLQRDTLLQLKEAGMPIIGAVYYGRNPPYNVVANINRNAVTRDQLVQKRNSAPDGRALMEVHEIGMGATLIDMRVFERIATVHDLPWFCLLRHPEQLAEVEKDDTGIYYTTAEAQALGYRCKHCNNTLIAPFFDYRIGKNAENSLSEDYYFCKLARNTGFSIYLSIHTEVEHEITMFTISSAGLTNSTITAGLA
jgi:hypothetical protein